MPSWESDFETNKLPGNPWFDELKHWLFPGICLLCGLDSQRSLCLCQACEESLVPLVNRCQSCAEPMPTLGICGHCQKSPPAFDQVIVPFLYAEPLDQLITGLKYGHNLSAGPVLGSLLSNHLRHRVESSPDYPKPDYLVAMPLHWRRRVSRGFNQAREIGRIVSRDLGIPMNNRLVRRIKHTPMQQGMDREARRKNLKAVFRASPAAKGLRIAVIDDVVTTASSARSIAKALKSAGAESVEIWCLARTQLEK